MEERYPVLRYSCMYIPVLYTTEHGRGGRVGVRGPNRIANTNALFYAAGAAGCGTRLPLCWMLHIHGRRERVDPRTYQPFDLKRGMQRAVVTRQRLDSCSARSCSRFEPVRSRLGAGVATHDTVPKYTPASTLDENTTASRFLRITTGCARCE